MNAEVLRRVLLWCTVINYGILLVWFLFFMLAHNWMYQLHGRWFQLSVEQFDMLHYAGISIFKIGIILLNLVPYIALNICHRYERRQTSLSDSLLSVGEVTMAQSTGYRRVITVFNKTGLFVGFMYAFWGLMNLFSITYHWLRLPSRIEYLKRVSWIWDETHKKSTAVWQDIPAIVIFCSALLLAGAAESWKADNGKIGISVLSGWLLLDLMCYHFNLLWLEAMRQTFRGGDARVWSHVRVVFQTFVNLAATIVLFAILYGTVAGKGSDFSERLFIAIVSGLTFNLPNQLDTGSNWSWLIWTVQEIVSILLILGVLPSLMAFKREEIVNSTNLKTKPREKSTDGN